MNYYSLINPSDDYSLKAPDLKFAALATILVSNGHYCLENVQDEEVMPIFMFSGSEEWFQEHFSEGLVSLLDKHYTEVADCLDSFEIVPVKDRPEWDRQLEAMEGLERTNFLLEWHEDHRSSMNDIGKRAKSLATACRLKGSKKEIHTDG